MTATQYFKLNVAHEESLTPFQVIKLMEGYAKVKKINMQVKFRKLSDKAKTPKYAKNGDAGLDIVATEYYYDADHNVYVYKTDLAIEIPKGHYGQLLQRSSVYKKDLILSNCVGVIDSEFRGEILYKFRPTVELEPEFLSLYNIGERVGQLVILPYPKIEMIEVNQLSETERGAGGFGSTGS